MIGIISVLLVIIYVIQFFRLNNSFYYKYANSYELFRASKSGKLTNKEKKRLNNILLWFLISTLLGTFFLFFYFLLNAIGNLQGMVEIR